MAISPSSLRRRGERLRERASFLQALFILDQAIIKSVDDNSPEDLILSLKDRSLTWLHLFNTTQSPSFLILARKDAEAMVETAKTNNLSPSLAVSYYTLAKTYAARGDNPNALKNYTLALNHFSGTEAESGDYLYHLGEAHYLAGHKKKGKSFLLQGLKLIRRHRFQVETFLSQVWETRCLMVLAKLLQSESPVESKRYREEAARALKSNPKLILLRGLFLQWFDQTP